MPKGKVSEYEFIGALDHLPTREKAMTAVRHELKTLAAFYGFEEMGVSPLESARAFLPLTRGGLFDERPPLFFRTRTGLELLLRPSSTLSLLRAYSSHKMNEWPHPLKFSFENEAFSALRGKTEEISVRREWGLLVIGEEGPIAEAEILQVIWKAFEKIKITGNLELRINALGCQNCRQSFRSQYHTYFRGRLMKLCKNCKRSFKRAPTRILLCGDEKCIMVSSHSPQVLDFLCELCKKHLKRFLEFLDEIGIPYFLDSKLFREGSWYGAVIFEIIGRSRGEGGGENTSPPVVLVEGGRVSRAGELMAGKRIDAAAGVVFLDTMANFLIGKGILTGEEGRQKVFLVHLGELAKRRSLLLLEMLRAGGIETRESLGRDAIKSQLKIAENEGVEIALILGQKEALDNTVIVREMSSGIQETIPQEKLIEFLEKKLKK